MKKVVVSVIATSLLFVACSKKETPKEVAEKFINDAIIKADFDALKKYATPQTVNLFQLTIGLSCNVKKKGINECYKELMQKDSSKIKKAEVVKVKKIDDNHASVYVKEYFTNGAVKTERLDLVKVDGQWKVGIKK